VRLINDCLFMGNADYPAGRIHACIQKSPNSPGKSKLWNAKRRKSLEIARILRN
jgi:hypothetical protein